MTEKEKIAYAKSFIDELANGRNPLDGTELPESDIVNNVRISRCLFYVSGLLDEMIAGNTPCRKRSSKPKKLPFAITDEQAANFKYSYSPLYLSEIARRITALVDAENMKALTYNKIAQWLISLNMLEEYADKSGKSKKRPTDQGVAMGISTEQRERNGRPYEAVLYNREAQQFIVDNIQAIIEYKE